MATPTAYFRKQFVPLAEAKISVMTHAFNYGTAVFEGIRGNWNEEQGQIYIFRLHDHFRRMHRSCRILKIELPYTVEELADIAVELVAMSGYQEDLYIRPIAYKSSEILGLRLHNLEDDLVIYVWPFGPYLDIEKGIRCGKNAALNLGIDNPMRVSGQRGPDPFRLRLQRSFPHFRILPFPART